MAARMVRLCKTLYLFLAAVTVFRLTIPDPSLSYGGDTTTQTRVLDYRLSGPHTFRNLTVYLVHGDNRLKGKSPLTLDMALQQKLVVVHETGNVNQLEIENLSESVLFVQSGDIVKGGRQDRLLASDVILPPKSGKVTVEACCVEAGRWQPRGKEIGTEFHASSRVLASQGLRLSGGQLGQLGQIGQIGGQLGQLGQLGQIGGIGQLGNIGQLGQLNGNPNATPDKVRELPGWRLEQSSPVAREGSVFSLISANIRRVYAMGALLLEALPTEADQIGQEAVWAEVARLQTKLQMAVGGEVKSRESASSLQLTLENNKVSAAADKYVMKLLPSASSHQDVIGFVFAINGRIKTGDIYGSHELFQQVWPRLLQAAAVEAFADFDAKHSMTPPSREEVASFLVYASKGLPFPEDVSKSTRLVLHPRRDSYYFETFDPAQKDVWFHRSFMTRGRDDPQRP